MTIHKEVLELAFKTHSKNERHRTLLETRYWCEQYKLLAKTAIEALAQPEQEPLAYIRKDQLQQAAQSPMLCEVTPEPRQDRIGIYTTPPQRTWVGLTDEEFFEIWNNSNLGPIAIKTAIEDELKEKNT